MNAELDFWQGEGGDAYMRRNEPTTMEIARRQRSLSSIIAHCYPKPSSILEVGSGPGMNLMASIGIVNNVALYAVEPNLLARERLEKALGQYVEVFDGHAGAICAADASFDLCLTAGVLIHVNPDRLVDCMREIARVSRRYVLAIEYFAPQCEPVMYYGAERIWRNDFGRLYRDECGLRPVVHGFFWKEADEGYDSTVWWLMEKP